MSQFKIAFIGMGQNYPSHVWMRRMRTMLSDEIVVSIDDQRNTPKLTDNRTILVPRKLNRFRRAMKSIGLTSESTEKLRSDFMLDAVTQSHASHVLVHFLDYAVQFSDVWRKLDIPVVIHCHGYDITWDVHHANGSPVHGADYQDQVRALPSNVWFIANSTYTRDKLLELDINPAKIFIKRFGVPVADTPPMLSHGDPTSILFLGRLVGFKGPLETVKAFRQIASKHPGCTLDIAGDGPLGAELDALMRETPGCSIKRHGTVDLVQGKRLRDQAAIFTAHNQVGPLTRQLEAFGVSLLEAMGEGVPVVTGRSGGISDFVHHQVNGLLFEPGDIDAHAGMLDNLLSSPKKRHALGLAAWETVRDNYQSQHEYEDFMRIFEHVGMAKTAPTLVERQRFAA